MHACDFHPCVRGQIPAICSCLVIISPQSYVRRVLSDFSSSSIKYRGFPVIIIEDVSSRNSRKNSLELIELSSINKVSLV